MNMMCGVVFNQNNVDLLSLYFCLFWNENDFYIHTTHMLQLKVYIEKFLLYVIKKFINIKY